MKQKHDHANLQSDAAGLVLPKNVIRIDENLIRDLLDQVVTKSVKQTLHALLDAEASERATKAHRGHALGAKRYMDMDRIKELDKETITGVA